MKQRTLEDNEFTYDKYKKFILHKEESTGGKGGT